ILLQAEQGAGDTIQFVRYVREMKQRAARVIVACKPSLARLFQGMPEIDQVLPHGATTLPHFDCHVPMLSLPHFLGTDLSTVPSGIPYLHPRPDLAAAWRERLRPFSGLKIGLTWRGDPTHREDRMRSIAASVIAALFEVPGTKWFFLQTDVNDDDRAAFAVAADGRAETLDCGPLLTDFADTAAAIASLDLVISVDTAVAHLAGALGRPVWLLLPFAPDWRWLENREDSPWYPTLRLFRQTRRGDWAGVMERISGELRALADGTEKH
ncbi:MAG: glycosyltransferase family 9 protein, partial [Alphaproteobacteria bacterium]